MPKKGNKGKQGGGGGKHVQKIGRGEDEYETQGVILADSYEHHRFQPLTLEKPKTMLPLLGTPMINYSIDLLVNAGINSIIIVWPFDSSILEEWLQTNTSWLNRQYFPNLRITIERQTTDCWTLGGALRHIQSRELIKSNPFVLLRGDIVANISLSKLIEKQRLRYKQNSNNIMTCIFKKIAPKQRCTSLEDDLFVVAGGENGDEMLLYENDRKKVALSVSQSLFKYNESIEVYHNLCDCHIDICSPTVLTLFQDNFDYTSIRKQFFKDLLNSDVYNYRVFMDIVEQEYATRIIDWRTYHGISKDIIERWTFPLVLDNNSCGQTYLYNRGNVYKQNNVRVGRNSKILNNVVLGRCVEIGNKCIIANSVIGEDTHIGDRCLIKNCHIFGSCNIADNCCIIGAIIANNCIIGNNCSIKKGCVLSYGVKLDTNVSLDEYTKLTLLGKSLWFVEKKDGNDTNDDSIEIGTNGTSTNASSAIVNNNRKLNSATAFDILADSNISESMVAHTGQSSHNTKDSNETISDSDDKDEWDSDIVGPLGHGYLFSYSIKDSDYMPSEGNYLLIDGSDMPARPIELSKYFKEEEWKNNEEMQKRRQAYFDKINAASNNGKNKAFMNGVNQDNQKEDTPDVIKGPRHAAIALENGYEPLVDVFGKGSNDFDNDETSNNGNDIGNRLTPQHDVSLSASVGGSRANSTNASDMSDDISQYLMSSSKTVLNKIAFGKFLRDIEEAVNKAEDEETKFDNVIVEMTSLKLSHHAQLSDLVACVFISLFYRMYNMIDCAIEIEKIRQTVENIENENKNDNMNEIENVDKLKETQIQKQSDIVKTTVKRWKQLFEKFVTKDKSNHENQARFKRHQMDIIEGLEIASRWHKHFVWYFKPILSELFFDDSEMVTRHSVLAWYDYRMANQSTNDRYIQQCLDNVAQYVALIRNMESDDEDESGDDDDDDEEEYDEEDNDDNDDNDDDEEDLDSDVDDAD